MTAVRVSPEKGVMVIPFDAKVKQVIPYAKVISRNESNFIIIRHGTDEVKILRNLGYEPPAPILSKYNWANSTPYAHQQETAELLSMSSRAYVMSGLGCVDSETEYLTPTGWVKISDYKSGVVGQYDNATGTVSFINPQQYIKLPCDEMVKIKTKYGIDQMLSGEHRVLTVDGAKQEVISANTLYNRYKEKAAGKKVKHPRNTIGIKNAKIPVVFNIDTQGMHLTKAEIRVMVAVKADGYFPNKNAVVRIRIKKQRKKDRLRMLLTNANIEYTEISNDYPSANGFTVFKFLAPERSKEYTNQWWAASEEQRKVIADEFVHWDGSQHNSGSMFFSTIKANADFIQFCCASTGSVARVIKAVRNTTARVRPDEYNVSVRANGVPLLIYGSSEGVASPNVTRVASADGFKYCFTVPTGFLIMRRNGCIFATGNSGKSRSALFAYDFLRSINEAKRVLVVAPLSTLSATWEQEVFKVFPNMTATSLHGTKKQRLTALNEDYNVYAINHDGVHVILDELIEKVKSGYIDVIIVDELAAYRNAKTRRWKAMNKIVANAKWAWGMSGLPTPNAPTDAWAQAKMLTPETVPKYFGAFRSQVMQQITQFIWVPKKEAMDIVHKAMRPAVRFATEDCIDLPPTTYIDRDCELSKEQGKAYKEMVAEFVAEMRGKKVVAVNAGVKLSKLLQICGGFAYADGVAVDLDDSPRIKLLHELLDQTENKVLVFAPFKYMVDKLQIELATRFKNGLGSVAKCYGDTPKKDRDQIFNLFQNAPSPSIIVAHPASLSHGVTLTSADTIIWYSPVVSYETYTQANARIVRSGQNKHTNIIHIQAGDVERRVYKKLQRKEQAQNVLLDMFRDSTLGGINNK